MNPAIEISELNYYYRTDWTRQRRHAVKGLSLTVYEGEFFGFLGANGAGKTTTIKCLLDLVRPSTGSIKVLGVDSRDPQARSAIGFLPEQPYFYDHLSVEETLRLFATLKGLGSKEADSEIDRTLALLNISDRRKSKIRSLSKGLTQRVAMAQTILGDPRLLVLDEPFSGLDPIGRKEFRDLLQAERAKGKTIFICSHVLSDIEFLCDRASIMAKGELKGIYEMASLAKTSGGAVEITFSGNLADCEGALRSAVERSVSNELIRVKFSSLAAGQVALESLIGLGAKILSFEPVHSHLEDIFVKLVKGGDTK
jgi:ABC-2 type transport system ATP-binding protein